MPRTEKQIISLRSLSVDDLIKQGEEKRAELFALKFQAAVGSLEQTHRIPVLKKQIARIELVLGEKRKAGENTNKTIKADYNAAVVAAEESGKEVRKKYRDLHEHLHEHHHEGHEHQVVDEDAIASAMQKAIDEPNTEDPTTDDKKGANE